MSYTPKTINEVITDGLNRTTFLPAIQREYVWDYYQIAKLFDSLMQKYPIGSMLFLKVREEDKDQWPAYRFFCDFDAEAPHNQTDSLSGVNQDIHLVLDGQQRLTSLYIGLKGTYRYSHYRWRKTKLYLNVLNPRGKTENPEELAYEFAFRESAEVDEERATLQYWYLVGDILNHSTASKARRNISDLLTNRGVPKEQIEIAEELVEELHNRIFTERLLSYYEERDSDPNRVVEIFVRANTGGKKLEYSDILLSMVTSRWKMNARDQIHEFTDDLNSTGYALGKDFVLKGALYLTEGLPIRYELKNFSPSNLAKIEDNWEEIKRDLSDAVRLVHRYGFNNKNLTASLILLPVAFYLRRIRRELKDRHFVDSTDADDSRCHAAIQKWIAVMLLKNVFASASDRILRQMQDAIASSPLNPIAFPFAAINAALGIDGAFTDTEINNLLETQYASKYSYLILSLLYPSRDWRDRKFEEDHVFPKSQFSPARLAQRGYSTDLISSYRQSFNTVVNLELLDGIENREKGAMEFDAWFQARDLNFKERHAIPEMDVYSFDSFLEFVAKRRLTLFDTLKNLALP